MSPRPPDLYKATQLAEFCQVDLKTIHNWAERGDIRHFRTPGRHLRFRQADVVDFLQRYGYPIPGALFAGRAPSVYVIDHDAAWLRLARRTLAKTFAVTTFDDAIDGMVAVGADVPDAVVLDIKMPDLDGYRCLARLRDLPATHAVKTIVCSGSADGKRRSLDAGAAAFVLKPDVDALRTALAAQLGVEATPAS